MKNISVFIYIVCVLFIFSISGCSKMTAGNQNLSGVSVTEIQERIKEGKTTKKEVHAWLGEPSSINKDKDGNEVWGFSFMNHETAVRPTSFIPIIGGLVGGVDTKNEFRMLHITFQNNIVSSYHFSAN